MDIKKTVLPICVVVIILAFFLPWVTVESAPVGKVTQLIGKKKNAALKSISGFQVPVLANGKESKLTIKIIQLFNPGIQNADKKSYLIWLVPLLSAGMFIAANQLKDNKWVLLGIGAVGVLIFAAGAFKITTTNLDKLVINVRIGPGVWLTLIGYLGIGAISLLEFFKLQKR